MIRPYKNEDRPFLLAILQLNTPDFFAPSEEEDFIKYLNNSADNFFVITQKDEILGCGGYNLSDDKLIGFISWDIFHPKAQGKGLGSELTQFRIAQLRKKSSVKTIVVRTSQLAFKFYEKQGFVLKEIKEDYWAPRFHLYYMELEP